LNPYKKQRLLREPFVMYFILGLTSLIFIFMEVFAPVLNMGSSTSLDLLFRMGALWNPAVRNGDWWRLVTPIFLHIGFVHFAMNMVTLYYFGKLMEEVYGHLRFALLYLLSGIMGNLFSFAFTNINTISAGASTSIFGMFAGFVILKYFFHENRYIQALSQQYMMLIVMNLVLNLFMTGVNIAGHIGGAVGGALIGIALALPNQSHRYKLSVRIAGAVGFVLVSIVLLYLGFMR